jgi:nucleotide-binding universal stress UspA family protein
MAIVGAVDRSDRAEKVISEAAALAEKFDDEIHLVHAVRRSELLDSGFVGATSKKEIDAEDARDAAEEIAEEKAGELQVPYESVGLVGEPSKAVVKYADEQDVRYVVVSPRKRSRTGKALFGSTAQSILLNATCPVVSTAQNL